MKKTVSLKIKKTYYIKHKERKSKKKFHKKIHNIKKILVASGLSLALPILIVAILFSVKFLIYIQVLSKNVPGIDAAFAPQNIATTFYDKEGNVIYRAFGEEDRDPVKLSEIPPLVKWTFIMAEDKNFYDHEGIDVTGIVRCGLKNVQQNQILCGGSTITQQLVRRTTLSDDPNFDRKFKEAMVSIAVEKTKSKDEILEAYFNIIPEGSNIYGIKRAARFYFNKDLDKLSLAEIVTLASIPQNPAELSPTKSINPAEAEAKLAVRKNYILDKLEENLDKLNSEISKAGSADVITKEQIAEARNLQVAYQSPVYEIKAPHFVFYSEKLLQEKGYNNGQPFTLEQLETQGYKVYTSLDSNLQATAEETVKNAVNVYGQRYGADNAAMVVLNPKNGQVLALVGSKDFWGQSSPAGCQLGVNCKFEPQTNMLDTLQSYGSSMKPMVYYLGIKQGLISPNTILNDTPVEKGGYKPKNWDGKFVGQQTAKYMLINSRNIPAILLIDKEGVGTFISEMNKWGYTTLNDPRGYGPSLAIGGADLRLIEHAQAYTVFANGGELSKVDPIIKIVDRNGNTVYEANPKQELVADPRAVYLVNDMLNGRKGGIAESWDGRDVAGKTGTSENQRETLFIEYTPEIVILGFLGNNNNEGMKYGATGLTSVKPWVSGYMKQVEGNIPKTPFEVPSGITFVYGSPSIAGYNVPSYFDIPSDFRLQVQQPKFKFYKR